MTNFFWLLVISCGLLLTTMALIIKDIYYNGGNVKSFFPPAMFNTCFVVGIVTSLATCYLAIASL